MVLTELTQHGQVPAHVRMGASPHLGVSLHGGRARTIEDNRFPLSDNSVFVSVAILAQGSGSLNKVPYVE